MTYDQIVTLQAIVQEGSFKAAAKVLNKSQPSLSAAIKKLEEEFQVQIFSRENYRPELTEQGKAFYQKSLPALESFRELETYGKELGLDYETEISLSIDAICPLAKLSPVLEKFFAPQVTTSLNLHIDILEGLVEKILEHQVDFAVGSYIDPREEIDAVGLFETDMVPVVAPRFYEKTDGSLRELKRIPQIVVKSSSKKSSQKVVGALSGAKRWHTSDMFMKEQLISSGLGWGRLPLHQIQEKLENGRLVEILGNKSVERIRVPLYLLKSKTKTLGPNARSLWQHLQEACREQGAL